MNSSRITTPPYNNHQTVHRMTGVGARWRMIVTPSGALDVQISDRFSEQIVQLHHEALLRVILGLAPAEVLREFVGIDVYAHELLHTPEQLIALLEGRPS